MEYIYRFIEYINESNILSVVLLILAVVYLVYLHMKKEEDEKLSRFKANRILFTRSIYI